MARMGLTAAGRVTVTQRPLRQMPHDGLTSTKGHTRRSRPFQWFLPGGIRIRGGRARHFASDWIPHRGIHLESTPPNWRGILTQYQQLTEPPRWQGGFGSAPGDGVRGRARSLLAQHAAGLAATVFLHSLRLFNDR